MNKPLQTLAGLCVICLSMGSIVWACNIPVFRYALERWKPDACETIVFHDTALTVEQLNKLEGLRVTILNAPPDGTPAPGVPTSNLPAPKTGQANVSLLFVRVGANMEPRYRDLWLSLQKASQPQLPYVVVRTSVNDKQSVNAWHGSLEKFRPDALIDSPVRRELGARLLRGDSVVWLVLKSKDAARNEAVTSMLRKELKQLSKSIPFPEGLGLPGSELYAELPLLMQFTVLEIEPDDAKEEFLIGLFRGFEPDAVAAGQPLVIPVFGRGRALEVLSADRLEPEMVGDLTRYLCGACSCQVKERNPGFDLLISADWESELFGQGDLPPPPKEFDPNQAPAYVPIPGGKSSK